MSMNQRFLLNVYILVRRDEIINKLITNILEYDKCYGNNRAG